MAAETVTFRMPKDEVAGVDRPRYGSSRMWSRLMSAAGKARAGYTLTNEIDFSDENCRLRTKFEVAPGTDHPRRLTAPLGNIVLIRDGRGFPVLPNEEVKFADSLGWQNRSDGLLDLSEGGFYQLSRLYRFEAGIAIQFLWPQT